MCYEEESLGPKKSLDSYDSKNSIMIKISISVEHNKRNVQNSTDINFSFQLWVIAILYTVGWRLKCLS